MSEADARRSKNLSAWYGAARILYDLNFRSGRGEVVALMGRNGAGKSTTMKAIMGLMAPAQGTVRFNGEDISRREAVRDCAAAGLASRRRTGASSSISR